MDSPPQRSGTEEVAAAVLETVPLAMRAIRSRMREGRAAGLSVPQFRALLYVRRHPGSGLSEIAEHLGTSVPAASELVGRLVRQDLVVRATDPKERRRVRLTLSTGGAAHLDEAQSAAVAWLRELAGHLDPARRDALVVALGDLRGLIQGRSAPEPGTKGPDPA